MKNASWGDASTVLRRLAGPVVLAVCIGHLVHFALIEPYHVPTGSMAPTLMGQHCSGVCPRCGCHNRFSASGGKPCQCAFCQNCGFRPIAMAANAAGDHILVDKSVLTFRPPARWEIIVFRLFGRDFIKRVIGLPGELIAILGGDITINNRLQRKSLEECKRQRVLVFDNNCQPSTGWHKRWQTTGPASWEIGASLTIDARATSDYARLTYQHFDLDEEKCRPISNEYSYNGGTHGMAESVHDFMLECDVEMDGAGAVALGITDGQDTVSAEIALNRVTLTQQNGEKATQIPRVVSVIALAEGKAHHLEMALVDRRCTLAIDGTIVATFDLDADAKRAPVTSPFWLAARETRARFGNVRLYRDFHYTQVGHNAVRGKAVQLGVDHYFVLGDNSANSEDSRFWPDNGVVPAGNLIGKPIAVHFPSRTLSLSAFGLSWSPSVPDVARLRWLRLSWSSRFGVIGNRNA